MELCKRCGESYFIYQSSRQVCREKVSDIIYFERTGRTIVMCSRYAGTVNIYGSLAEVYSLLYEEGFEYINKSVVANFYQITNIKNNRIKLSDGNYVEISRSRRNLIMDKFYGIVL